MLEKNTKKTTTITRNQMPFEDWLYLAKEYYKEHGNLLVPIKYVTPTGEKLGIWIVNNRKRYADGILSLDRIKALNSIGMVWNIHEKNWQDMYDVLLEYQNTHGNLNVPSKYVTEIGEPLGRWLINQRYLYLKGTLPEEHQEKLESIGIIWKSNETKWSFMYKLATEYKKEHGNLNIPQNYITSDGKTLGLWLQTQRNNYRDGKLRPERIKLLEDIGISWRINKRHSWSEMFLLAKKYYEENGNLLIPRDYKAINGEPLGIWLSTQRDNYRSGTLSQERTIALESINVVWNFKVSKKISKYLKDLARKTSLVIDEELNKDILNHISLIELQSKIKYVTDMGALPIDDNGRLVDIFSMSSLDMEVKYGISLEAIIESYEVSNTRKLYF